MISAASLELRATLDSLYAAESRRVFATLVRLIGDFDLAEDAMHEAFAIALDRWSREGIPANPVAWLVSTGRFKAIDTIRRNARAQSLDDDTPEPAAPAPNVEDLDEAHLRDDQLRLIFTCCHPALSTDAQIALTLREVCGLTTEEVAAGFLTPPATLAQRIVRAKSKIRNAGIPYEVPQPDALAERLESVLSVIYLVFNEGYSASSGAAVTRADLCAEAIRLARLLVGLMPDSEAIGLLALMLLHDSRRNTRADAEGNMVLLEDQDRSRWNRAQIDEGAELTTRALDAGPVGYYTAQAAIASVHATAAASADTDWARIVSLYDLLLIISPSPVVELNRAVALSMRDGAQAGLDAVDGILKRGELETYHLTHAARADFLRRLGRNSDARTAYEKAIALTRQEPERRFLERRLRDLESAAK